MHKGDVETRHNADPIRPLFSVIVTCFNYESYVESAIKSVLASTFTDFETIVIDDGSTDKSWEVIHKYADRIKAYRIKNRGSIEACLFGLSKSAGKYVIFLDADDMLRSNTLNEAHGHISGSEVSKIQFLMQPIDGKGNFIGNAFPQLEPHFDSDRCIESIKIKGYYDTPPTSGNIYRRDVYENLGSLDYDFGIDGVAYLLAPFLGKVIHLSLVLADYRVHGNNRSLNGSNSRLFFCTNAKVFRIRLEHLNLLLSERGINKIELRKQYHYTAKNELMSFLAEGKKPPAKLAREYLILSNERANKVRRIIAIAFVTSIYTLPVFVTNAIISVRQNQSKGAFIRTLVKRLAAIRFST